MTSEWAILVPTLGERAELFGRLMDGLMPQVDAAGGRVRVVGWFSNGRPALPEIRYRLLHAADAAYVSFVDDDDLVAGDYVDEVLKALASGPDYVGFQVQCYSDGAPTAIAYHSLAHGGWSNGRLGGRHLRDISHVNPMRTSAARRADFRRTPGGRAEDRAWADQLRRLRALRSEVVIDRVMYHYLYVPAASRWRRPRAIGHGDRPNVASPYFSWSDPDA